MHRHGIKTAHISMIAYVRVDSYPTPASRELKSRDHQGDEKIGPRGRS